MGSVAALTVDRIDRIEVIRGLQKTETELIICPAIGCRLPSWEQIANIDNDMIYDLHRFTCTFTMARNPTITMPSGQGDTRIPTVVQLVGPHFGEERLVRAAHAFQSVTEWHQRHPLA